MTRVGQGGSVVIKGYSECDEWPVVPTGGGPAALRNRREWPVR